jgi:hypothetical protein
MYLKITNAAEDHHGLKYHDGLNIDRVPFAREGSCCRGGIYFTTPEYICGFISIGIYVREVTVPEDAEMVQDPQGDKWRASKVILGPKKHLGEVETWKWLFEIITCAGINEVSSKSLDTAFRWSSYWGYLEVIKYLVENGADIHSCDDYALGCASYFGRLEVVKYLIDNGANIHGNDDASLRCASSNGHLEVVKFLLENGADIHANDDYSLNYASYNGHLEVVEYLAKHGAT